jgi:hypothetical protein
MIRSVVWEVKFFGIGKLLFGSTCRKTVFYRTTTLCDCYPAKQIWHKAALSSTFSVVEMSNRHRSRSQTKNKALSVSRDNFETSGKSTILRRFFSHAHLSHSSPSLTIPHHLLSPLHISQRTCTPPQRHLNMSDINAPRTSSQKILSTSTSFRSTPSSASSNTPVVQRSRVSTFCLPSIVR